MTDKTPTDKIPTDIHDEKDPNYRKKLEASYLKCLNELCEPCPNWQDKVMETKFTMDTTTGMPKTTHIFVLDYPDDIIIDKSDIKHSYVFKRTHFYLSFIKQRSRLKRDLISCWKVRGYYIRLYKDENLGKWCLGLSWRNKQ